MSFSVPTADKFIGGFKIIQMKKVDQENARRDAESIIKQKRTVEDGDYAILEITDDVNATLQYYTRSNEQWQLDDSIDAETFADSAKMFCNLNVLTKLFP